MAITQKCSWIPESLVFIAILALYQMAGRFLSQPSLHEFGMVLVVILSLFASLYWLFKAHTTRKMGTLGNILLTFLLIMGGTATLFFHFVPGGFDCPWPISAASIIYGGFLLWKLPNELVFS